MQFASECRDRALILIEIAKEAPEFEDRLLALAQSWLTLAALEDLINGGVGQADKSHSFH